MILLLYIPISLLCILFLLQTETVEPFRSWASAATSISFIHAIISLYVVKKVCTQWTSFPLLFIFGLLVFNYGQLWLYGFVPDFKTNMPYNKITIYPKDVYVNTCVVILSYIAAVTCGIYLSVKKRLQCKEYINNIDLKVIKRVGIIVLLISLPFNIYENSLYIIASMASGYLEVYNLEIPSYINTLSWMSVMGVVCLLLGFPNYKNKIMVLFMSLYLIEMFSGARGQSVIAIITLMMFYNLFYPLKLNFKKTIATFFVLSLGIIILPAVKNYRGSSDKSASDFISVMAETSKGNALYDNLDEFGGAIAFPSIVQMYIRETGNYLYGWTYWASLFAIFPNIGIIDVGKITQSGSIAKVIQDHGAYGPYQTMSSSCVSETLMNFGFLGTPIFAFFVGMIIGHLYKRLEKDKYHIKILYYVMACYGILFWTRGAFGPLVRFVIWGGVFIFLIKYFSMHVFNYKKKYINKVDL